MIIDGEIGMRQLGERIGSRLIGGEVIELIGDVGAGKTTLTRGIAKALGITESLQSPTFTISREYHGDNLRLVHYDFYRLNEPGIMADELAENLRDQASVVVIEWSDIASDILPEEKLIIKIKSVANNENQRQVELKFTDKLSYVKG